MPDSSAETPPIITRFAPSPTGHLHIGGARTALFCWAIARGVEGQGGGQGGQGGKGGGRFLLRIEDTDLKRSSASAAAGILDDLAWLGITWDEGPEYQNAQNTCGGDPRGVGPFHQSQRTSHYQHAFDTLIEKGLAYPAFESGDELGAMRKAAKDNKQTFIYRRRSDYDHQAACARMKTEPHVLRFAMPSESVMVHDAVLGEVEFPYAELDDLVIRKADGMPTYHLAVVVDDELMGVTHVLRGQEHLNNTPRHVALQKALGYRTPVYAHMPLIFNADGSKMSKRDKDKIAKKTVKAAGISQTLENVATTAPDGHGLNESALEAWSKDKAAQLPSDQLMVLASALELELPAIDVEDFRSGGYLPEVVCNYLALLGWSKGDDVERFTMDEFCKRFTIERIGKSAAKFDREKLMAFNFDTIQSMSPEALADRWRAWCERYDPEVIEVLGDRMVLAAGAARQRAKTLRQLREPVAFVFVADGAIEFDAKAVKKNLTKNEGEGLGVLRDVGLMLGSLEDWSPESIEGAINDFAESQGLGMGKVAQPIRVAMTGAAVSPGLGHTLGLLGKASVLARIERCLAMHKGSV